MLQFSDSVISIWVWVPRAMNVGSKPLFSKTKPCLSIKSSSTSPRSLESGPHSILCALLSIPIKTFLCSRRLLSRRRTKVSGKNWSPFLVISKYTEHTYMCSLPTFSNTVVMSGPENLLTNQSGTSLVATIAARGQSPPPAIIRRDRPRHAGLPL